MVQVEAAGGHLTLDDTRIYGGTIKNLGTVEVTGTGSIASGAVLTNTGAQLTIDASSTLKLSGGTITGGTITNNNLIDVGGSSTINGNAALNGGQVTVEANQTLTLDDVTVTGTTFTDTASGAIISIDPTDTLTLSGVTINGGTINDGTGSTLATAATITIAGSSTINGNAALNNGGVTVDANQTLTLDNDTVTGTTFTDTASGAIISIDPTDTLTLSGVTINGGTINDGTGSTLATAATITVSGTSKIENASLNKGGVTVDASQTLTLDNDTVTGTTFTDGSPAIISVDSGDTLTLSGVTISDIEINDGTSGSAGTIVVSGSSTINDNASLNNGGVTVDASQTLTLDNDTVTGTTSSPTRRAARSSRSIRPTR